MNYFPDVSKLIILIIFFFNSYLFSQAFTTETKENGDIIYTMDILEDKSSILPVLSPDKKMIIQNVTKSPQNMDIKFHTDLFIVKDDTLTSTVKDIVYPAYSVYGKYSFRTTVNEMFGSNNIQNVKMSPIAGLEGSRINISNLKKSGQRFTFYKRSWAPKSDSESLIIVTEDKIIGVNVVSRKIK